MLTIEILQLRGVFRTLIGIASFVVPDRRCTSGRDYRVCSVVPVMKNILIVQTKKPYRWLIQYFFYGADAGKNNLRGKKGIAAVQRGLLGSIDNKLAADGYQVRSIGIDCGILDRIAVRGNHTLS